MNYDWDNQWKNLMNVDLTLLEWVLTVGGFQWIEWKGACFGFLIWFVLDEMMDYGVEFERFNRVIKVKLRCYKYNLIDCWVIDLNRLTQTP